MENLRNVVAGVEAAGLAPDLLSKPDWCRTARRSGLPSASRLIEQAEFGKLLDGMRQRVLMPTPSSRIGIRLFENFTVDPARACSIRRRYKAADARACYDDLHGNSPPYSAAGMPASRRALKNAMTSRWDS